MRKQWMEEGGKWKENTPPSTLSIQVPLRILRPSCHCWQGEKSGVLIPILQTRSPGLQEMGQWPRSQ
jgi:hypothetical protein